MCYIYASILSTVHTCPVPQTLICFSTVGKSCGLERNYLFIFEAKPTELQWGLPPHALFLVCSVRELVELRKANSVLYTTEFIQHVCSSSKCVTYDKEVTFKRNLPIFNNDSQRHVESINKKLYYALLILGNLHLPSEISIAFIMMIGMRMSAFGDWSEECFPSPFPSFW